MSEKLLNILSKATCLELEAGPENELRVVRTSLFSIDDLPLFQKVAAEYGVLVEILAEEGESYSQDHGPELPYDPDRISGTIFKGLVPEGHVHVKFSSETFDLSDFWETYNSAVEEAKR